MELRNWGNYPVVEGELHSFSLLPQLDDLRRGIPSFAIRGLGRSYGDSSLYAQVVSSQTFDRFLSFDEGAGIIECQAGASLAAILDFIVPKGWFLPVTPGTKFVTLGGAVAADVHGKNHHSDGSFSRHVEEISLMLADGAIVRSSRLFEPELFAATCGGMGLTGVILSAKLKLHKIETAWIRQRTVKAANLDELMQLLDTHAAAKYSVAWIDCLSQGSSLGRSILMLGEHAASPDLPKGEPPLAIPPKVPVSVPFFFPEGLLNGATARLFNTVYYAAGQSGDSLVPYDKFFYPLDGIHHWNRVYGKRGFCQYQFVLPKEKGREGVPRIIEKIASCGEGSFLAVLKLLGKEANLLSFPMEGYTLALDFPLTKNLFSIFAELDKLVLAYGGRLYLAKDARMERAMLEKGYPQLETFMAIRKRMDPQRKFRSVQSERLGL